MKEVEIQRNDIQTFERICTDNIATLNDPIIKSIYLRRRYELQDDTGLPYNLLASLFKGRATPTVKQGALTRDMTPDEIEEAQASIRHYIADFDYAALLAAVADVGGIAARFHGTDVGYEKIQLFRIISDEHDDDVIRKFINESYHIENEYVMQLNPHKFESIPEYVIQECARLLPKSNAA